MLTLFGRKKLTAGKVAHIFVNNLIDTAEQGFPDVAGFINDSLEFELSPQLRGDDYGKFLMIIVAGNYQYMGQFFNGGEEREIIAASNPKLAEVFQLDVPAFELKVKEYKDLMSRINHPSKNVLYAMSKAVFFRYELNAFQQEYFRSMNTPNPIFLKNLDEIMKNFLWDWDAFKDKYKVVNDLA